MCEVGLLTPKCEFGLWFSMNKDYWIEKYEDSYLAVWVVGWIVGWVDGQEDFRKDS